MSSRRPALWMSGWRVSNHALIIVSGWTECFASEGPMEDLLDKLSGTFFGRENVAADSVKATGSLVVLSSEWVIRKIFSHPL
ncbi:hypothetical protein PAPYR_12743 [Paratrimastix pyriformis]|uniref:Uncharacterized protein n=1 Tax=Paratrimastix pyriformis TaxID=342808 RepID=A0ABQ8U6L1_9EUKA|nr:hypothetical protein PAPYR_12743 [Paratrimastix pyriformis]